MSGYSGIFNVTNSNNKFYFIKSITHEDGCIKVSVPPGAYEEESLNNETKRFIINEGLFTEVDCPFTKKPNSSTLGSIIELSTQRPVITFVPEDSLWDLLGFNKTTIYEENNLSHSPVDTFSFGNIFLETDNARSIIFKGKRSGIFHNFTTHVDPSYKYIEKFEVVINGIWWNQKIIIQQCVSN